MGCFWSAEFESGFAVLVRELVVAVDGVTFAVAASEAGPIVTVGLSARAPGLPRLRLIERVSHLDVLAAADIRGLAGRLASAWSAAIDAYLIRAATVADPEAGPAVPALAVGLPAVDGLFLSWLGAVHNDIPALPAVQVIELRRAFVSGLWSALSAGEYRGHGWRFEQWDGEQVLAECAAFPGLVLAGQA